MARGSHLQVVNEGEPNLQPRSLLKPLPFFGVVPGLGVAVAMCLEKDAVVQKRHEVGQRRGCDDEVRGEGVR